MHGEVYSDVPRAFARWRRQGREIAIYSSGSVLAQKLLFGSVLSGDLTQQIRDFFDTGVGVKTAAESYMKIAATMEKAFSDLSRDETRQLEQLLKRVGKKAELLFDESESKARAVKRRV